MKYDTNRFRIAVIAPMLLASAALADSIDDQNAALNEKQVELAQRLGRLDAVGAMHGRYVLLRDASFAGREGVRGLAEKWHVEADGWVKGWHELLELVRRAPDLPALEAQSKVKDRLLAQQASWAELKRLRSRIRMGYGAMLVHLDGLGALRSDAVPGYESQVAALKENIRSFETSMRNSASYYESSLQSEWDTLVDATDEALITKLKQQLVRYPELRQALARLEEMVRAERVVEPLLQGVRQQYDALGAHIDGRRVFHAEDALAALEASAEVATNGIRGGGFDAETTTPALQTLKNWTSASQRRFRQTFGFFPNRGAAVQDYVLYEAPELARKCRDAALRKELNCDLLRTLVAVPSAKIAAMSNADARYFEFTLERVKGGPLAGAPASERN